MKTKLMFLLSTLRQAHFDKLRASQCKLFPFSIISRKTKKRNLNLILLSTLTFLFFTSTAALAEIRYVSKTGTATPPYTTWATASDSIQKAINICNNGDTVVVANGVYKEFLTIDSAITLLGTSMDSTIIDGRGLGTHWTVYSNNHFKISGFKIIGRGVSEGIQNTVISTNSFKNLQVKNCLIVNANKGIHFSQSSDTIQNVIMRDINTGVFTFCGSDTCKPVIKNSIIVLRNVFGTEQGIINFYDGQPTILNNIIIGNRQNAPIGIDNWYVKRLIAKNNLIAGFQENINAGGIYDSSFIINNVLRDQFSEENSYASISNPNSRSYIRNNIITNNVKGIYVGSYTPNSDYNIFWNNEVHANNGSVFGANDIFADPMFVKDTVAKSLSYDYHLQKYSPGIDAGDKLIHDVDGSRSDIGMYGGPLGETYTYQDLAPRNPVNLTAEYIDGLIHLKWNKNTAADFYQHSIYRDTVSGFIINPTKLIASVTDTFYNDNVSSLTANSYYYKLTAVDSAGNGSAPSEEIRVVIIGLGEMPPKIVEDYKLMQNYPNPFNPSTKIGYRLKESGYVKIMVYNVIGERVGVLVNSYQNKGYHEVDFTSKKEYLTGTENTTGWDAGYGDIVSGIYLYRIEVTGEGNIPVFSDMKKMILVK